MIILPIIWFLQFFCYLIRLVFLPTTLASLPSGVMLLNRSTAPRGSATDIKKTSQKGTPEREQPNRSIVKTHMYPTKITIIFCSAVHFSLWMYLWQCRMYSRVKFLALFEGANLFKNFPTQFEVTRPHSKFTQTDSYFTVFHSEIIYPDFSILNLYIFIMNLLIRILKLLTLILNLLAPFIPWNLNFLLIFLEFSLNFFQISQK